MLTWRVSEAPGPRVPRRCSRAAGARVDEGKQMVSEDKGKKQLKRRTLEFAVKYSGWQKPEEKGSQIRNLVYTGCVPPKGAHLCLSWLPLDLPATPKPVPSPLPVSHKGHKMPSIR